MYFIYLKNASGGGNGNDSLNGGAGNDTLSANYSQGDNLLDGGNGNDSLSVLGDVFIYRGEACVNLVSGNNTLNGGAGDDNLVTEFSDGNNLLVGNEVIRISAVGFGGGLSAGVLSASQFKIGASATTTTQRFIYNSTTGGLFFDQDGSAGGFAQVQFALVATGLPLTNTNFVVV
ncbi:hypothetical protein A6S26_32865 [Nostoc sp. ATCC 43529]|nr:hypothetical protein A6S26_32865 [Nostoc sp. ATCC 43529]